ncbi:centromere protein Q isoform X2 [Denticeps clupeoides]|uniref:centromere protein Q isoform X2 n=1 Tax=Denticeps clupeoides TaxID=299321 RepID=UPI0010A51E55|nr:centromere protein Q isoform X2 [Denticeps clupeoides]
MLKAHQTVLSTNTCAVHSQNAMKPSRGSQRPSSQGPKRRPKKDPEAGPSSGKVQPQKPKEKRNPSIVEKVKGRDKWRPLSSTATSALENMLNLSVLSVLSTMKEKKKGELQKHLNILKERFLESCIQLPVPPQKHRDFGQMFQEYQKERKKTTEGQKRLQALEIVHSVESTLEEMEVRVDSLDEEIRIMRSQLEDQEERAQEVLNLPPLSSRSSNEYPLEERLKSVYPHFDVAAFQNKPAVQKLKMFLQLGNERLFAP